jgi:hypothetical protein
VVPGGDNVDAAAEELVRRFRRQPFSPGGVLAVGNDQVQPQIVTQAWHQVAYCLSARPAYHITDNEYPQWPS